MMEKKISLARNEIPTKVLVKKNESKQYLKILKELFEKTKEKELLEIYSAPFVLFCATSLEYFLNELIINYTGEYFSDTNQDKYAKNLISINFNTKLTYVLPMISGNIFEINLNSFEYKKLCEVITKRNQIAHGKDFYSQIPLTQNEDGTLTASLYDMKANNYLKITAKECENYMKALNSFYENIYIPCGNKTLKKSKLILEIVKKQRETHTFDWGKE